MPAAMRAPHRPSSNANAQKAVGSHILAIGVGAALQNAQSRQRLISVSGPNVFNGVGSLRHRHPRRLPRTETSAELEDALRDAAFQLCAPSVNIRKLYDPTPGPRTVSTMRSRRGVGDGGHRPSVPAPGTFHWVLPICDDGAAVAAAPGPPQTGPTNGAGFLTFQWTPTNPERYLGVPGDRGHAEQPAGSAGWELLQRAHETDCTFRTPDIPTTRHSRWTSSIPTGGFIDHIPPESIVTCRMVNLAEPVPGIDIEKATNGVDADDGFGPIIPLDDPVIWTYVVTNTGNTTLDDVSVSTPRPGAHHSRWIVPSTLPRHRETSMTCTETSTAVAVAPTRTRRWSPRPTPTASKSTTATHLITSGLPRDRGQEVHRDQMAWNRTPTPIWPRDPGWRHVNWTYNVSWCQGRPSRSRTSALSTTPAPRKTSPCRGADDFVPIRSHRR